MPNPYPLPHPAEVLGGISQPFQYGSDVAPATQCIAHGLGQWSLLARVTASIGRENGQKVTFVTVMHGTQEPQRTRMCKVIQESSHTLYYYKQHRHGCLYLRWYGSIGQRCGSKLEKMPNRSSFSKSLATSTTAAMLMSPSIERVYCRLFIYVSMV